MPTSLNVFNVANCGAIVIKHMARVVAAIDKCVTYFDLDLQDLGGWPKRNCSAVRKNVKSM